ncbi:MAG: amidophosphoribosyltransferase [Candidatus Eisenbacteria bacterium]|uniref:Amidophosphoribosyltransferase n=1 Tax=Eiseniibacteriota bacterium TaxID=2212470 RepID=A0A538T9T0_UNCEI|nr:MAG: amidophosphoribosyltransferase [Candidatus Eisenbacteria bacterium]
MNGGEALSENRELEAAASRRLGDRLHEECGVFGIWGAENAARLTYAGLYALQHRGQESAGIVATDGVEFRHHKAVGLVSDVFAGAVLDSLKGHIAIGHNRYSTQGSTLLRNAQPLVVDFREGMLALGHNGNLVNAVALRNELETQGSIFQTTSDTEVILHLIARSKATEIERMIPEALARCQGAYTLVILAGEKLIGLRDPRGFRPLCLGKRGDAHVLASETCALDMVGADFIREIAAGEMVVIDGSGVRSYPALKPKPARACVFELIYFSRPDSEVFGESVDLIRRRLGRRLAEEHPVDADIVISVPDSSNSAALGFSEASRIPFELGLIRNHYVGRTFIAPQQVKRDFGVNLKFNPVRRILEGKRVVVVDDSIVRGTTSRSLVAMLRGAGAREIHFRVSSPPIAWSCYYGIDTPNRKELIASSHSVEEIRKYLHVDTLGYLSMEGLRACVSRPDDHCYACFDGKYSEWYGEPLDKLALEQRAQSRLQGRR